MRMALAADKYSSATHINFNGTSWNSTWTLTLSCRLRWKTQQHSKQQSPLQQTPHFSNSIHNDTQKEENVFKNSHLNKNLIIQLAFCTVSSLSSSNTMFLLQVNWVPRYHEHLAEAQRQETKKSKVGLAPSPPHKITSKDSEDDELLQSNSIIDNTMKNAF